METSSARNSNLDLALQEFREGRARIKGLPVHIDFEATTRCNLRCFTCVKAYTHFKGQDASPELFDKVADALFHTAESINLTGCGEPLLSPHFSHFINRSAESGLDVGFITNGSLLNEEWIERLYAAGVQMIVSLDTTDAEVMSKMRPGLKLEPIIQSLRYWKKLQDQSPRKSSRLRINYVPTKYNIRGLPQVVELAGEVGALCVEVLNFCTVGVTEEAADMSLDDEKDLAARCFADARERARELDVDLILPPGFERSVDSESASEINRFFGAPVGVNPPGSKYPLACSAPWFRVTICLNGNVYPCCAYPWPLGNLNEHSFEEIWNGKSYRRIRRRINSRFPQYGCKTCRLVWGITAGHPESIFSRERLIDRWHTKIQTFRHRIS